MLSNYLCETNQWLTTTSTALAGLFLGSFFIFDFSDGAKLLFKKVTTKKAPAAPKSTDSSTPKIKQDTVKKVITDVTVAVQARKLFYEIEYEPAIIIDSIISDYLSGNSRNSYSFELNPKKSDTLRDELRYRKWLTANLPDSELNQLMVSNQLFINKDAYDESCLMVTDSGSIDDKKSLPVLWDYYISYSLRYYKPITPYHLQSEVHHRVCYFTSNNDFFTANPPFLLWALLLVVQFGLFPSLTLSAIIVI